MGTPDVLEPKMLENPQAALLSLLEAEDGEQHPEEPQADEQPEQPEASGEPEADVDAEEEPEEAPVAADAPKTLTVKVDGEEIEVTEDELLRGYSRHQDYTRKTMKLAEERKAFEAEAERVRAERAQYAERLEAMRTVLDQQMGAEPDWDQLRAENPAEYAAKYADWQRQQNAKDRLRAEQDRVQQQMAMDQQTRLQAQVAQEREKLLHALPEWRSPDVARKEQEALIAYGSSLGFSEDELANLYDHRAVLILQKARLYDEAQAKGKTVLKEKTVTTPTLKPGARTPSAKPKAAVQAARERFQKSHHPRDAAALIEHLLED